ncbi:NADP-dependent oxidoreductase [Actinomycetospora endophytica]|uniref:NADP-dependent oxidoreductase n=1 Tax=Actinomycetospora endophytica TaxID=2291215 RepID=A0ABS8P6U7_9PSEU|nr:NADP-dependent oxidoreductase [Actinomycetospora endophytica]MCD2193981.1 NADP-dependent oxidoreductase [Actinomycetospora endophytica]
MSTAHEVHLVRRPHGFPDADDFRLVERELGEPGPGEAAVVNRAFSVDPYMRGRMNDVPSYVAPFGLDEAMDGRSVGEVSAVGDGVTDLAAGDLVLGNLAWRDRGIAKAKHLQKVPDVEGVDPKAYLGVLGAPGLTAWVGLLDKASFQPGDAVFVSGAAGAVGSLVGQIAKAKGASRVVGSAGSAEKVRWLTDELGFDAAFNYRDAPVLDQLEKAMPSGLDVYFDNVGADHLEAAIDVANDHARVAACGAIAHYNDTAEDLTPGPRNLFKIVKKRLSIQGFIVTDSLDRFPPFLEEVTPWVAQGRVRFSETVVSGVDHAVEAFQGLLRGENTGKMLVTP